MGNLFYTVGQMASICHVSVQTLRYYDRIGLVKPSRIDEGNRYRYYSDSDILYIRIIQDLKETGFSLDEIKNLMKNDDAGCIVMLLEKKRSEFQKKERDIQSILDRIDNRIENMKIHASAADTLTDLFRTVEIKQLPERTVAFTRFRSDCSYETLAKRFYELDSYVKRLGLNAFDCRMAVYHDFTGGFDPKDCDLETCISVLSDSVPVNESCRIIPGGLYATGIYKGEYEGQCNCLIGWIQKNGYETVGPGVEVYLNSFMNTRFPRNYLTEVQFPIKKY